MAGHGSPPAHAAFGRDSWSAPSARRLHRSIARYWHGIGGSPLLIILGWLLATLSSLPAQGPPAPIQMRLRMQLISETPQRFQGWLRSDSGSWKRLENLSMDPSTTGAMWFQSDGQGIELGPRGYLDRLGFDVDYSGPRDGLVTFRGTTTVPSQPQLPAGQSQRAIDLSIPLGRLMQGDFEQDLGGGLRFRLGRVGGDPLRLSLDANQSLVFAAGQPVPWRAGVTAFAGTSKATALELLLELRRDGDSEVRWKETIALDAARTAQVLAGDDVEVGQGTLNLPASEGVYTLTATLQARSSFRFVPNLPGGRLLGGPIGTEVLLTRPLQFVVLAPQPPVSDEGSFQEILRWRPASPGFLNASPGFLNLGGPATLSNQAIAQTTVDGAEVAEIAPGDRMVQTLSSLTIGKPHLLVIRYARRGSGDVKMSVAIRQHDPLGTLPPLGVDAAVVDEGSGLPLERDPTKPSLSSGESAWGEQQIVFWPRVEKPLLVIRNHTIDQPLHIESIRLLGGRQRLSAPAAAVSPLALPTSPSSSPELSSPAALSEPPKRMAAIYLDKPLLQAAFGCRQAIDPGSPLVLDDWNTFYEAAERLVDYVQYCGANTVMLTVVSEGGSLVPSPHFMPSPRYDTGVFFSDGRDPVRKDVLELLLRFFDRAGLRVIPTVELAFPLPALEQQFLAQPPQRTAPPAILQAAGVSSAAPMNVSLPILNPLEWSDSVGRRLVDRQPPNHGLAPYYNLLHPEVQQQVRAIFRDLASRYGDHPSLAGIGLSLGSHTYLQLPPPQWGRDPLTLSRFRQTLSPSAVQAAAPQGTAPAPISPRGTAPAPISPEQWASDLWLSRWADGPGSVSFAQWRAGEVLQFYRELAGGIGPRPLVLVTADYIPPEIDGQGGRGIPYGLDWRQLGEDPRILPLRLQRQRWMLDPARRIDDAKMNEDEGWDLALGKQSGGLLFYPPQEQQIDLPSAYAAGTTNRSLSIFPSACRWGLDHRRHLARLLDRNDSKLLAIGGWTPLFGQEESVATLLATYAMLPHVPFEEIPPSDRSGDIVRVRQARVGRSLFVYAINPSPWQVTLALVADTAVGTKVRTLGPASKQWLTGAQELSPLGGTPNGTSTLWSGVLEPGSLVALEVQGPGQGVVQWNTQVVRGEEVLRRLTQETEDLATRITILGRPRRAAGFDHGGFEKGEATRPEGWLRAQHPVDSVQFSSDAVQGIRSLRLQNVSGLSDRTWILSEPFAPPDTGRLALSLRAKRIEGNPTIRVAIEGRQYGQPVRFTETLALRDDQAWGDDPYWLRIVHPGMSDWQETRIAIDLIGPGSVAVDDVCLYDFFFTERERSDLQRQIFVASERLKRGDLSAAGKLLDSHWARYLRQLQLPSSVANPAAAMMPQTRIAESGERSVEGASQPPPAAPREPGLGERLRSWLPGPLRF